MPVENKTLKRTAHLAHLPIGTESIYIVEGTEVPYSVRKFTDFKNLSTAGEFFLLYWPESDSRSTYHCGLCFLTQEEAHKEANRLISVWVEDSRAAAKNNRWALLQSKEEKG